MSTTTVGAGIPGLSGGRPREAARAAIDRYTASGGEGEGLLSLAGRCVGHAAREVLGGAVDDARLVASVEGWHRLEAAVHAEKLRRIAALAARQGWVGQAPNPARMLVDLLGVTPGEARLLVDAAEMLERMPQVAARLAAGELSAGHVAELTRTVGELKRLHGDEGGDGEGAGGESAGARALGARALRVRALRAKWLVAAGTATPVKARLGMGPGPRSIPTGTVHWAAALVGMAGRVTG